MQPVISRSPPLLFSPYSLHWARIPCSAMFGYRALNAVCLAALLVTSAHAYGSGNDNCNAPGHGTNYGTGGGLTFTLKDASGTPVTSYVGGGVYTITLTGTSVRRLFPGICGLRVLAGPLMKPSSFSM